MKKDHFKKAVKLYSQACGNFKTVSTIPLRKEADLASMYYPGISAVLEKISKKPQDQGKYCRQQRSIAVIGTRSVQHFPLLSAKAAILSEVADVNAIPLMIRYENPKKFAFLLNSLSTNFQAFFCGDIGEKEREILKSHYKGDIPLIFHEQTEAAAVVAAVLNASKMMKKTPKKVSVTIEGKDQLTVDIVEFLMEEKFENITLIDARGPLYRKRPNMNRQKKRQVEISKAKKDERTREEVLSQTDIFIHSLPEDLKASVISTLPAKATVIALKVDQVEKGPKQALVSTLPTLPNHLTDLHIVAGMIDALCGGKKYSENTLSQAIRGLAAVYKSPKPDRIIPGLLEKNLAKKIAKAIK